MANIKKDVDTSEVLVFMAIADLEINMNRFRQHDSLNMHHFPIRIQGRLVHHL